MTRNAQEFVTPLTFQTLSGNPVVADTFALIEEQKIGHIALADLAGIDRHPACNRQYHWEDRQWDRR